MAALLLLLAVNVPQSSRAFANKIPPTSQQLFVSYYPEVFNPGDELTVLVWTDPPLPGEVVSLTLEKSYLYGPIYAENVTLNECGVYVGTIPTDSLEVGEAYFLRAAVKLGPFSLEASRVVIPGEIGYYRIFCYCRNSSMFFPVHGEVVEIVVNETQPLEAELTMNLTGYDYMTGDVIYSELLYGELNETNQWIVVEVDTTTLPYGWYNFSVVANAGGVIKRCWTGFSIRKVRVTEPDSSSYVFYTSTHVWNSTATLHVKVAYYVNQVTLRFMRSFPPAVVFEVEVPLVDHEGTVEVEVNSSNFPLEGSPYEMFTLLADCVEEGSPFPSTEFAGWFTVKPFEVLATIDGEASAIFDERVFEVCVSTETPQPLADYIVALLNETDHVVRSYRGLLNASGATTVGVDTTGLSNGEYKVQIYVWRMLSDGYTYNVSKTLYIRRRAFEISVTVEPVVGTEYFCPLVRVTVSEEIRNATLIITATLTSREVPHLVFAARVAGTNFTSKGGFSYEYYLPIAGRIRNGIYMVSATVVAQDGSNSTGTSFEYSIEPDWDGDGLSDAFEALIGFDPYDPFSAGVCYPDGLAWFEEEYTTTPSDEEPPTTQADVGEPSYAAGGTTYVTSQTPITLTATDNVGVASVHYCIDGGGWVVVLGSSTTVYLEGLGDGYHTIEYYAVDLAGNEEEAKSITLYLDDTPPTTSASFDEESLTLALTATDEGCGVNATYYRVVGYTDWQLYAGPIDFSGYEPGNYTVEFYSVDNLGNQESVKSTLVEVVDKQPPSTQASIGDPSYSNGTTWFVTSQTPITLNATDNVGVSAIRYRIDGGEWIEVPGSTVMIYLNGTDGVHTIDYYAVDASGNVEEVNSLTLYLDNTPPTTSANFDDEALTLTLSASDGGCGVNATYYRVVGYTDWQLYAGPIDFSEYDPGTYQVEFYSVDNLGNQEEVKTTTVEVPQATTTPPTTTTPTTTPTSTTTTTTTPTTTPTTTTSPATSPTTTPAPLGIPLEYVAAAMAAIVVIAAVAFLLRKRL